MGKSSSFIAHTGWFSHLKFLSNISCSKSVVIMLPSLKAWDRFSGIQTDPQWYFSNTFCTWTSENLCHHGQHPRLGNFINGKIRSHLRQCTKVWIFMWESLLKHNTVEKIHCSIPHSLGSDVEPGGQNHKYLQLVSMHNSMPSDSEAHSL